MEFYAEFTKRIKRTDNVISFRFITSEIFNFSAGQFIKIIFDKSDYKNNILNKYLSISNAPWKSYIEVTKKISDSDFSKKLLNLKLNDKVLLKGPMGKCIHNIEDKKIGFLIGGIGVTPVISIIESIIEKNIDIQITFLYSNWLEKDIAFKSILDKWAQQYPLLKIIYILKETEEKSSQFFKGFITKEIIEKEFSDFKNNKIFIFGPPIMVNKIKEMCIDIGCLKENLQIEQFTGY